MSTIRKYWRYFLAYQDSKQEHWLEEQARRGLHLKQPGLFRFSFVESEPSEEKYRLDFQMLRGRAREEYLTLFRDAGWDFLGQVANRYYFRARPDAFAPEIFSDAASKKQQIRRQMGFMAIITGVLAYQTMMGVSQLLRNSSTDVAILTVALAGPFLALGIWCVWQMERAYRRVR